MKLLYFPSVFIAVYCSSLFKTSAGLRSSPSEAGGHFPVKKVQKQPLMLPQPPCTTQARALSFLSSLPQVSGVLGDESFGFNLDAALEIGVAAQSAVHCTQTAEVLQEFTLIRTRA